MIVFDVSPEDETTSLDDVEKHIRAIEIPGLSWSQSQRIAVAFGIFKLRIASVMVDSQVESIDTISEGTVHRRVVIVVLYHFVKLTVTFSILALEQVNGVSSCSVCAFNKI